MVLVLAIFAYKPVSAQADFVFTASGGTGSNAVDAQADFSLNGNTLTIVLTNLQPGMISAGQAISGLEFMVTPPGGDITSSNATLESVTGNVVSVSGGKTTPLGVGPTTYSGSTLSDSQWDVSSSAGLTALTGGKPNHLILDGDTSGFNSSVNQHTPDFQSSATFVLTVKGMNSNSTISGVIFDFGTSPETSLPGTLVPNSAPAPPSIVLLGVGGLCLAGFLVVSRRRMASAA
jgi:hypothetical protein